MVNKSGKEVNTSFFKIYLLKINENQPGGDLPGTDKGITPVDTAGYLLYKIRQKFKHPGFFGTTKIILEFDTSLSFLAI